MDGPAPSVAGFRGGGGGHSAPGGGAGGTEKPNGVPKPRPKKPRPPAKVAESKAKEANNKLGDLKSLRTKLEAATSLPLGFKFCFGLKRQLLFI